ncbi:unnamed protein product [Protopolystoma xenopodis]|uniref:Uncharacterized protein n=1 Tax=Protopolystoma xenopodis TaxID=117903 RepID=A0A3S5AY24_9PLAT|nr:unnamed protein product [Protopolystoma xenopodis]
MLEEKRQKAIEKKNSPFIEDKPEGDPNLEHTVARQKSDSRIMHIKVPKGDEILPPGTPRRQTHNLYYFWPHLQLNPTVGNWCLTCNHSIHNRLPQLALHYARRGRRDLIFGFTDYTLNEYPGLKSRLMPHLKLFPKNSDDEIDFEGDEKYRHMKVFIESMGKNQMADVVGYHIEASESKAVP